MFAVIIAVAGCVGQKSDSKPNWNFEKNAYSINNPNESINVSFFAKENNSGWIENDNDFPVTIKAVEILDNNGEITMWIKIIDPKDMLTVENILYYRYFISVDCNEKAFVIPS
jgi:hypothetical protein